MKFKVFYSTFTNVFILVTFLRFLGLFYFILISTFFCIYGSGQV